MFLRNETVNNGNARRDKKQGKKAPERNALNHNRSDGTLPDLGALCIWNSLQGICSYIMVYMTYYSLVSFCLLLFCWYSEWQKFSPCMWILILNSNCMMYYNTQVSNAAWWWFNLVTATICSLLVQYLFSPCRYFLCYFIPWHVFGALKGKFPAKIKQDGA